MTEITRKLTTRSTNKGHSEFYRHVILPSKTYAERHKSSPKEVKEAARTYNKQPPLSNADIERQRSSLQRQLSIDMLRQGYHQAFRELSDILTWQKDNREQSRSEQPQVLIEDNADKLRFLSIYLTKAEEAERRRQYAKMYESYLAMASFFREAEDYWLSDYFYKKCLTIAQAYSQLDTELVARAYLNIGSVYERHGDLMQALASFKQYYQAGENYYDLRTNANLQLVRIYMKLAERRTTNEKLDFMVKAYEASIQSDDKKIENEIRYKLGLLYLELNDIDAALQYLEKYYDYCQQVNDDEGFGQASEAIAICYQKKSNIEKSTEYLTKYLQKASGQKGSHQYTKACNALGLINATLGDYDSAIASCSKAYSISLATRSSDLDRCRLLYGIANGLKLRGCFNEHIDQMNTKNLLDWKQTRLESHLTKSKN
ncbi:unnamed protein product [Adineta ricciae]|uniref:Tetratricopeptide repeat protein 29 n=1 Tax=Adineta ricciae TaxID=249248 RepID=A0A815EPE1_ADIRI|nr:unnamed protein product [Adineta ricciae]CAF1314264.1 unnamed protein product [Adineta ricciae]